MESIRVRDPLTVAISVLALLLSVISIVITVVQFDAQNRGDLLANCAFNRDAETRIKVVDTVLVRTDDSSLIRPNSNAFKRETYALEVKTKCLVQNNGRKAVSIIKARAVETYDGKPTGGSVLPASLYENDLVDASKLPFALSPGESKEVDIWLDINIDTLNKAVIYVWTLNVCRAREATLKTYLDYDKCLANNGFYIANHLYIKPFPYLTGPYNGVGIQFLTNENMVSTFEVDVLRSSIFSTRGEEAKLFDEERKQKNLGREKIYLYRGYRENLTNH